MLPRLRVRMVTAEFLTKRHFVTYEFHSMSGGSESEHAEDREEKVLVASSATAQPTDMSNGKSKKRRGRVPSFINPFTGRPNTLALAAVLLAVVLIVYMMSRPRDEGPALAAAVDERAPNPKFHHILVPPEDDPPDLSAGRDSNFNRLQRPNVFQAAAGGHPHDDAQALPIPKLPPLRLGNEPPLPRKPAPPEPHPNPKDFPVRVIHKPAPQCPETPYVLFVVACLPSEALARTAVRRSWGKPEGIAEAGMLSMSWRTVFVMGRSEAEAAHIERESESFGDVLQGDFEDLSSEVTRKVMLGFQWAVEDTPVSCRPSHVFKTSIGVYMNMPLIVAWITSKLGPASDLYVGKTLREDRPIRDKQDPLYVPSEDYPRSVFPTIARGPLYLLSMDVVQRMVPRFGSVVPIAMEDAYVGLLAHEVGVTVTEDDHFVLIKRPKNFCHYRNMLFVFDLLPTEVMHVYNVVEKGHRYSECADRGF